MPKFMAFTVQCLVVKKDGENYHLSSHLLVGYSEPKLPEHTLHLNTSPFAIWKMYLMKLFHLIHLWNIEYGGTHTPQSVYPVLGNQALDLMSAKQEPYG